MRILKDIEGYSQLRRKKNRSYSLTHSQYLFKLPHNTYNTHCLYLTTPAVPTPSHNTHLLAPFYPKYSQYSHPFHSQYPLKLPAIPTPLILTIPTQTTLQYSQYSLPSHSQYPLKLPHNTRNTHSPITHNTHSNSLTIPAIPTNPSHSPNTPRKARRKPLHNPACG